MTEKTVTPLLGDDRAAPTVLNRSWTSLLRVNWETVAWILLLIVTAVARFYQVGERAMSHDESLHSLYSFYLFDRGNYIHDPMMHGPFLFHFNSLVYALFGVTDATARLGPVLAGIGAVAMAFPFRRYIGRSGALAAGILICISPSLLFHSRYIRNDIYIVFYNLIWAYGLFRYLDTRHRRWLLVLLVGMALGFITKENQFMTGAVFGVFFAGLAGWRHLRRRETLANSHIADLAVLMLTLVLPFTAPFPMALLGWDPMAKSSVAEVLRAFVLVGLMTALSAGIAYGWYRVVRRDGATGSGIRFADWAGLMVIFWVIQLVFFTTFLTNAQSGLHSGVVGSLGYWLSQQEVARGSQPWYYYILVGWLYEFLPLLLTMVGGVTLGRWLLRSSVSLVPAHDLPAELEPMPAPLPAKRSTEQIEVSDLLRQNRELFLIFGFWWAAAAWFAYSYAGERMPWLMTHIALPMCLCGGWWLGRALQSLPWGQIWQRQAVALLGAAPAALGLLAVLLGATPFQGRGLDALSATTQWLFALLILVGVIYYAIIRGSLVGWAVGLRLVGLGLVGVLFLLTVRFSYMLTYINYDYVNEYLVYAHASPDIKRALAEIDLISQRTVGERNIVVSYDDDSSWPLSWYMRNYPNAKFYGATPSADSMNATVVIVGPKNYEKVRPYMARDYIKRTYRLVWWPEESYKGYWDAEKQGYAGLTLNQIGENLRDPVKRNRLWQIFFYRRHPDRDLTQWPHRHEFEMYIRRDVAAQIWELSVTPVSAGESILFGAQPVTELDLQAVALHVGPYAGLPLAQPRAVAVGPDGTVAIADSNNHRIVLLDQDGSFLHAFGSLCRLEQAAAGGCVDPDGGGPLALGDGQFNEPWGVALGKDGRIYVSDTWNGRIQVFDAEGNFLTKWGVFAILGADETNPNALYGPRSLALDQNGNLLVTDTGNKRLLRFTPNGQFLDQVGGGGVILGRFDEPVGVAVDPRDGAIYVADTWNRRIQKLNSALQPLDECRVPGWEGQSIVNKPGLAVDNIGNVYAADPEMYRVLVYAPDGTLLGAFGQYGAELDSFALPVAVAIDRLRSTLWVADSNHNRVVVYPTAP